MEITTLADNASLTFFSNPIYYGMLERKKLCKKDNSEAVKFYRKRIVSLFKDILKAPDQIFTNEIKEFHTLFVNSAIRHFEMLDKKDIIQGQHAEGTVEAEGTVACDDTISDNAVACDDTISDNTVAGDDTIGICSTIDEANDKMMRKIVTVANLDNYVIKQDNSTNEIRIIPVKIDIDLKTPDLKTKGVKKSKKQKEDLSN